MLSDIASFSITKTKVIYLGTKKVGHAHGRGTVSWKSINSREDCGVTASAQLSMSSGLQQDQFQVLPPYSVLVKSLELAAITQERPYLRKGIRKGKSQEEGKSKYVNSPLGKDLRSPNCLLVFCLFN